MDEKPKYTPDLATVTRESSKAKLDEKLQRALDNPELDRAIARVKPKLKPGEDPLFYDVNRRLSVTSVTPVDPSAPSPVSPTSESGDLRPPEREPSARRKTQTTRPRRTVRGRRVTQMRSSTRERSRPATCRPQLPLRSFRSRRVLVDGSPLGACSACSRPGPSPRAWRSPSSPR